MYDFFEIEIAGETIAAYMGYFNRQLFYEMKKPEPERNQNKMAALELERHRAAQEMKALTPDRRDLIDKAYYVYAPIVKMSTQV